MRYLRNLLLIICIISAGAAFSQNRADKKAKKQRERVEKLNQMRELAENKSFVIHANFIYNRYNQQIIAPMNNIVMIDGDEFVLQTANPQLVGVNGLGGYTFRGEVTDYEILSKGSKNNQRINIIAQVQSPGIGQGTLNITITGPENARARFTGNFGQRITFEGRVEQLDETSAYVGNSLFGT